MVLAVLAQFDRFVSVHGTCRTSTISRLNWISSLSSLTYTLNGYHTTSPPVSEFDRKIQLINMDNSKHTTVDTLPPGTYGQIHDTLVFNTVIGHHRLLRSKELKRRYLRDCMYYQARASKYSPNTWSFFRISWAFLLACRRKPMWSHRVTELSFRTTHWTQCPVTLWSCEVFFRPYGDIRQCAVGVGGVSGVRTLYGSYPVTCGLS